jgi:hypothetical protein
MRHNVADTLTARLSGSNLAMPAIARTPAYPTQKARRSEEVFIGGENRA